MESRHALCAYIDLFAAALDRMKTFVLWALTSLFN